MTRPILAAAFLIFSTSAIGAPVPPSFADLAEELLPTVVNISTTQEIKNAARNPQFPPGSPFDEFFRDFFNNPPFPMPPRPETRKARSLGSGFVIDSGGYIVTNNHVIGAAEEIEVVLQDERKFAAELVGRDVKTDLALLKIDAGELLLYSEFGDSARARVGDWVIAIGNPFGLGGTVTAGIISARSRDIQSGPYDDYIQTDAPINRGNSGGPLFNLNGEVIAINAVILSPGGGNVGIGFAISSNLAKPVLEQLKKYGQTRRGWLGVKIQEVTPEIAEALGLKAATGALVAAVNEGEPAETAGLKVGDVILSFANKKVDSVRQLRRVVADTKISKNVEVVVWRDSKTRKFTVTVGNLEAYEEAQGAAPAAADSQTTEDALVIENIGLKLHPLTDGLRRHGNMPKDAQGVYILDVRKDSPAAKAGLRPGEVIVEIGSRKVTQPQQAEKILGKGNIVLLLVRSGAELRFTALKPPQE